MSSINLVDIGFSNYVEAGKILTISRPDSSPIKRVTQHARENNLYLDLTQGKKTRSLITLGSETGTIIAASAINSTTIAERIRKSQIVKKLVENQSPEIIEVTGQSKAIH